MGHVHSRSPKESLGCSSAWGFMPGEKGSHLSNPLTWLWWSTPFWDPILVGIGEFTTHVGTYFSGWMGSRSQGYDLDFDPWRSAQVEKEAPKVPTKYPIGFGSRGFVNYRFKSSKSVVLGLDPLG